MTGESKTISPELFIIIGHRKLKNIKKEPGEVFAEIMLEEAPMIPVEKVAKSEIFVINGTI